MKLTGDEADKIIFNNSQYFEIVEFKIDGNELESKNHEVILKYLPKNQYYIFRWTGIVNICQNIIDFRNVKMVEVIELTRGSK